MNGEVGARQDAAHAGDQRPGGRRGGVLVFCIVVALALAPTAVAAAVFALIRSALGG